MDLPCRRAAASAAGRARRQRLAGCLGRRPRHHLRAVERRRSVRGARPTWDVHRARRARPADRAHDLRGDRDGHRRRRAVHAVAPRRDRRRPGAPPHRRPRRQRLRVDCGGPAALPRQPRRARMGRRRLPRDGCAGGRAARRRLPLPSCPPGTRHRPWPTGLPSASSSTSARTWARLTSPRVGIELTLRSSLPRLWQWVDPASGTYALGIEPANCSVLGRAHDIATGRMPFLDPGEARTSWLTLAARLL